MQLPHKQLAQHLRQQLAPVYLLHSDDPLLIQEARDAIRAKARESGFGQYQLLCIEPGFDWPHFTSLTQNMSLFSEKILIDLRNPTSKFDEKGLSHLLRYCENPSQDVLLLLSLPKLTSTQLNAKWVKGIEQHGVSIAIWPLFANELPRWIQQRLQQKGLRASQDATELLAQMTAGNLLATQQAIDKLPLLFAKGHEVQQADMWQVLAENARYGVFDLTQAVLLGQIKQVSRIMAYLPLANIEPPLVLWALSQDMRELIDLQCKLAQGHSGQQLLQKVRPMRKPQLQAALQRCNLPSLYQALRFAAKIDGIIKGQSQGDAWQALTELALAISGKPLNLQIMS